MGIPEGWYIRLGSVRGGQTVQQHEFDSLNIMPAMKLALRWAVLLCAVCAVLCYRSPQSGPSGSYSLPSIGKYPAPTVFNPKNQGLPDAYKHSRMSRSVDDQVARGEEQLAEEPALEEVIREARSVDGFDRAETLFENEQTELLRQRRSPQDSRPTYRPPPTPPKRWIF